MSDAPLRPRIPRGPLVLVCTRGLSSFGSAMTAFALDVWIFRTTGSYTTFALLAVLTYLPNLLIAPFAGALVDRADKKSLLIACELVGAAMLAFALFSYSRGTLDAVVAGIVVFTFSSVAQLRWIAMGVAVSMLVEKPLRPAINGIQQSFQGATEAAGPLAGAGLLYALGFGGVLALDIASCAIGLAGLAAIRGPALRAKPRPAASAATAPQAPGFWKDAAAGFAWIGAHREMLSLLLFIMGYNLAGSIYTTTFAPYLLGSLPPHGLALALCLDGGAALLVGVALMRWGRRIPPRELVYGAAAAFGMLLIAWGVVRIPLVLWMLSFCAGVLTSTVAASLQTVWQDAVPIEIQGRVFAARRMVSFLLVPLAILSSIPASQSLVSAWLAASPQARQLWGEGVSAPLGMMLSLLGIALLAAALWFRPSRPRAHLPAQRSAT